MRWPCSTDIVGNFSEDSPQQDCYGHGTHVASVAMGRTVGVAKEATAVAVRVLDCEGVVWAYSLSVPCKVDLPAIECLHPL